LAAVLLLALSACSALAQVDTFDGVYHVDCKPIGPSAPAFERYCEEAAAKSRGMSFKFSSDASGTWTVEPALSGSTPRQELTVSTVAGFECFGVLMAMVCRVPRNKNIPFPESPYQSRSGVVLMVTNLGMFDLIKVTE
jgi:hypothetical protein